MKASFLLFAGCNLALLCLTALLGLLVRGTEGFARHFLLGVLAAMFACFVHVVTFMYFVVQEKIVRQSVLAGDVAVEFHRSVQGYKSKALRWSLAGIGSVFVTVALGAGIGIYVSATAHLVAAFAAIGVNGAAAYYQYSLLHEYREDADRYLD